MSCRVLFLEERGVDPRVQHALARAFDLVTARSVDGLRGQRFEVAVVGPEGKPPAQVCQRLLADQIAHEIVLLGSRPSLRDAVAAIHAGATDFVPEGSDPEQVVARVREASERRGLVTQLAQLQDTVTVPDTSFPSLLGSSDAMQILRERLRRVAPSEATVLILGESGSGKELVARAIHEGSPRRKGPFVAVNCSAIAPQLMESEFFGHAKGAFTDASSDRVGLLAQSSSGTLFLDEVGDMALDVQAKLLRALQERAVRPLGQQREVPFDSRVIAATRCDLADEVARGRFRQDLYFRLNVVSVRVPPLRDRNGDILLLAQHFMQLASQQTGRAFGLTPAAARALLGHGWPGNVRELEHRITSAVAAARYDHIRAADLRIGNERRMPSIADATDLAPLSQVEKTHILNVLETADGNKALAARLLGVDRKTLYRKLKEYAGPEPSPRARMDSHPE
ncbi:MAG: sigma-54-dependent Fis family transcriptional regulator [Polyangiaceae bacterium]|nr:sigma-54-dependent Fis family transcriptional regulator [Polyangiaceae bacterium]